MLILYNGRNIEKYIKDTNHLKILPTLNKMLLFGECQFLHTEIRGDINESVDGHK